jgi:hypothetical protein
MKNEIQVRALTTYKLEGEVTSLSSKILVEQQTVIYFYPRIQTHRDSWILFFCRSK